MLRSAGVNALKTNTRMFASASHELNGVGSKSKDYILTEQHTVAQCYHPMPVVFSKAEGCVVTDPEGKSYYDFLSAYSAVNQGHQHPRIVKALIDQLTSGVALSSRAFYNDKLPTFAKFVTEYFGYERVLPMNTGAEAVETALKLARKYAYDKRGVPANEAIILSACGCFHGRTLHAISMSCDPEAVEGFGPLVPNHDKVRYNDLAHLEAKLKEHNGKVAAFIVEPIQGEAGVYVPDNGYLKAAMELCHKYGALFMADEVQTGIARTGKLLAVDYEDIKPDVVILGKAISGGLYPVSAVLASDEIMSVFKVGTHGSTFGGNPLACAVAMEALTVVKEENLAQRAYDMGVKFRNRMQALVDASAGGKGIVEGVRGKGLLNAFVISTGANAESTNAQGLKLDKSAWDLCLLMKQRGLLAKPTHGNIIRLAPPLVINTAQFEECMDIIESSCKDIVRMDRSEIQGADPVYKPQAPEAKCPRCHSTH